MLGEHIAENGSYLKSFIEVKPESDFPIQNLPFGVFKKKGEETAHIGSIIGDQVIDLTVLQQEGFFKQTCIANDPILQFDTLNPFMALGRQTCRTVRTRLSQLLRHDNPSLRDHLKLRQKIFIPVDNVTMQLPVEIKGYTDFYSSKEHATNLGIMFRGKEEPLLPNWLHLPIAYDGRSSSIVVSGTDFQRPMGQILTGPNGPPAYAACQKLCCEVEVAFFVGEPSQLGQQIVIQDAPQHIFGLVLFNDWSARDIQRWEYQPLGPFLGKNFCSSISPWIVTLDALEPFRIKAPEQEPIPLSYLQHNRTWNFDIKLELLLQTASLKEPEIISQMNFKDVYWDCCQQLAHHTVNGCRMQTGDLFASGTISGDTPDSYGSMIELSWAGSKPIKLSNQEERKFLQDGDRITIKGHCQNNNYRIGFGEVTGKVLPALQG